jgi:hypothetical protein
VVGVAAADTVIRAQEGGARYAFPHAVNENLVLVVRVPPFGAYNFLQSGELGVVSLRDRRYTPLGLEGTRPAFVAPDLVTFVRDGSLMAVRVDPRSLTVRGSPQLVVASDGQGDLLNYAVARNGIMVVRRSGAAGNRQLVLVDRDGQQHQARPEVMAYRSLRFSPAGDRLLFSRAITASMGGDIYVLSLGTGALLRLTNDSSSLAPEWSADGRSIYYARIAAANAATVVRVPSTGGGAPVTILERPRMVYEFQISTDESRIIWREDSTGLNRNIFTAPTVPGGETRALRASNFDERGPALSPDGEWYLFASDETGITEVYVARVDGDGARWPVSAGGGAEPRWARNGEVFYFAGDALMVTRLTLDESPRAAPARRLFTGAFIRSGHEALWDVSPDGQRFAFVRGAGASNEIRVELLLHWAQSIGGGER